MRLDTMGLYGLPARSPDILISMEVYVTLSYRKSPPVRTMGGHPLASGKIRTDWRNHDCRHRSKYFIGQ